jgi:hypothetical protein
VLNRIRREDGSVTLAMSMLVVGSIAVMALLSTLLSGLNAARIDQARSAALQSADGGLDAALHAIDRDDFSEITWVTAGSHFTASSATYEIDAKLVGDGKWTVRSVATEATTGRRRFVVATVGTDGLFPDVLFTTGALVATGGPPATGISSDSLGSNTSVSLASGLSPWWAGYNIYGSASAAEAAAACTNCATEKVSAIANDFVAETQPVPSVTLPCPGSGTFAGQIEPGDYLCTDVDVSLAGGLATVVTGTGRVRIWIVNGSFSATGNINNGGDPEDLQIFQSFEDGSTVPASFCNASLKAMLHLPGSTVDCSSAPTVIGAVVAASWNGPISGLTYDSDAADIRRGSGYTLADWHECPVPTGDLTPTSAAWRTSDC